MKTLFVLACLLVSVTGAWADPAALLTEVLQKPGAFVQMCASPDAKPRTQLPLFGYQRDWASSYISVANCRRLRAERAGVVKEAGARLVGMIPKAVKRAQKEAQQLAKTAKGPPYEVEGDPPLELCLRILLDLNGVEALPDLLRLEQALSAVALHKLPPAVLDAKDHPAYEYLQHTQVLSVITALLQNEKAAGLEQLRAPAHYDARTRDLIVKLARDFLKTTRPESYRGAAAMKPLNK